MTLFLFRMLPGKELLNAARVNRNWFNICKSDFKLRQKLRRYLRQQRRAEITTRILGTRRTNNPAGVSNRPAMINVVNAVSTAGVRRNSEYFIFYILAGYCNRYQIGILKGHLSYGYYLMYVSLPEIYRICCSRITRGAVIN